ncbi:MAG: hypothetical protein BHW00_02060 [Clostridium sp. 26_22]|nr:MAG: hypothetical protein BHW00_02060 [Clostridium sp. 26_22]
MKTIGLACTGGGTKALSNLGVIKALEELNIKISAISGTSIGSCIAVLYAMGYTTKEIEEKLKIYTIEYPKFTVKDKILAPFKLLAQGGGKNPSIITKTIREATEAKGKRLMSDLDMPVFIPTMDITEKKTVYYTSRKIKNEECYMDRPIEEAVKNTCSLPLLYIPNNVYIDGKLHQFLDGGMTHNIPTHRMNQFVDYVIGVENVYYKETNQKKVNIITGIRNTFQSMRRTAIVWQRGVADLIIRVDCKDVDIIGNEEEVEQCVKAGYDAAMEIFKSEKFKDEIII